jgi:type IV pilus assembly protein PilE
MRHKELFIMRMPLRGFTLIEVMIVVAIIAVLAAVAFPSYQSYVQKSRRADGRAVLQAAQLAQEKFRLNSEIYASTADFGNAAFARVCPATPCLSPAGYYVLTSVLPASPGDASGYTLTATAKAGTSQVKDTACLALTLTQTATAITYGPNGCWSK